jgi:dihydrolipoamide dehydrogenase
MTNTQVAVVGGGPGGYVAAFHAADLGMQVTLVEMEQNPGGVCLYRGCIPSKALLHVAALINEAEHSAAWGVTFAKPTIEIDKLRAWKQSVVDKLTGGLGELAKRRKVNYIQGRARFTSPTTLVVEKTSGGTEEIRFENAILATGSRPTSIPTLSIPSPRVFDSTGALALEDIPESLLVVGGGYIGLELGTVYAALGSRVSVVEMTATLLPGADRDLVMPLARRIDKKFEKVMLETTVLSLADKGDHVLARFKDKTGVESETQFDKVLIAVGRRPNTADLGLETTSVVVNPRGFVEIDTHRRTAEPTIFAIGDIAGEPMLAHKASHEGLVAADVIAGGKSTFSPYAIPAVVFTDPEIAWCGLTETQAAKEGREVRVARFPWAASGRATTLDRNDGLTKIVVDPKTERILGVGVSGAGAGELIAEGTHAVEMASLVSDLKLTIHPHPTLSETLMEAADVYFGESPHMWAAKKE